MTRRPVRESLPNRCVLVADGARARFFTITDEAQERADSWLIERGDLLNPEAKLTDEELFEDRSSGRRNRSSVTGGGYSLDDENARASAECCRCFAREVSTATADFLKSYQAGEVVIIASPRFLGVLRPEVRKSVPPGTRFVELPSEMSARSDSCGRHRHGNARSQRDHARITR